MIYITFDPETGEPTGCYRQELQPAHADAHLEVTEEQAAAWPSLWVDVATGTLTDAPQDPAADLAAAKARAWERVKAIREHLSDVGGYPVVVGGDTKWFHSDPKSKTQQLALARRADRVEAAGGDMDAILQGPFGNIVWKTMNGSWVPVSANVAHAIADAAEVQDLTLFARAEQLRAQINASADPASIDLDAGWPATYGS